MVSKLNDEEKKRLIEYCIDIGFIIQEKSYFELNNEKEKTERIATLINKGYRLMKFGDKMDVINLNGRVIGKEIRDEIIKIYEDLLQADIV
jgi:hypothetical protein